MPSSPTAILAERKAERHPCSGDEGSGPTRIWAVPAAEQAKSYAGDAVKLRLAWSRTVRLRLRRLRTCHLHRAVLIGGVNRFQSRCGMTWSEFRIVGEDRAQNAARILYADHSKATWYVCHILYLHHIRELHSSGHGRIVVSSLFPLRSSEPLRAAPTFRHCFSGCDLPGAHS